MFNAYIVVYTGHNTFCILYYLFVIRYCDVINSVVIVLIITEHGYCIEVTYQANNEYLIKFLTLGI